MMENIILVVLVGVVTAVAGWALAMVILQRKHHRDVVGTQVAEEKYSECKSVLDEV